MKRRKRRKRPSAQRSIPIDKLYRDGIIKCGSVYSKSWRFSDVNYDVASDDDKEQMFLMHSAILNGLPSDAFTKISIYNRTLGNEVIKQMVSSNGDESFEQYKRELIDLLHSKMEESNSIVHDKYITVSTEKKNLEEAKSFFTRVGNDLTADFARLGSKITELEYKERGVIYNGGYKEKT